MPHFFVDDSFSDSKEVMSIPARHRLAAVGLWTLCGSWSAGKLTDGHVPDEVVKRFAGRSAGTVEVLIESTLWERTETGIRFTNWDKWQRTRDAVVAYRLRNSAKQKRHRERLAQADQGSEYTTTSPVVGIESKRNRVTNPVSNPVSNHTPVPTPIPSNGYVSSSEDLSSAGVAATPGANLVREIVPKGHPAATLTALRLQASELINTGTPPDDVAAGLRLWVDKPSVGIGRTILASMVSEAIKSQNPAAANGRPKHKLRAAAELAAQLRTEENTAAIANQPRKELQ